MGIFDRGGGKKGTEKQTSGAPSAEDSDYYDSPVEQVSLSDAPKSPGTATTQAKASASAKSAAPAPAAKAEHHDDEPRPHYGIENAIQLMRALPPSSDQNVELVVAVIKGTLESLKVKVSDIIEDASRKQKDLENRVLNLKQQISDFEKEIATRKGEIEKLDADHAETTSVKGKLELAEKAQKAAAAHPPATQKATSGTIASGGKA